MEDIRGVRLRKFKLRKIILGVRMHFRHSMSFVHASVSNLKVGQVTLTTPIFMACHILYGRIWQAIM